MRPRLIFLTVLCLLASLGNSVAGLRIVSAYFGRPERNQDVRRAVEHYVDHGIFAFRISGENLGARQHVDQKDFLRVIYEVDGRRYMTDGVEGQVFTFSAVQNPVPDRIFGLPGRPPLPQMASVRITNAGRAQVSAFSIDQHGAWRWQAEVPAGRTSTEVGVVGFDWVLANHAGAVLERFTIRPGENRVSIEAAADRPAFSNRYTTLRIENNTDSYVAAYSLDQWRAWNWKGGLAPGSAYEASAPVGETWVVATSKGKIVRQFDTASRMGVVRVAR